MKKIYLITGGTGFIGSSICKRLAALGGKLIIFDNLSRNKNKDILINKEYKIIKGDIRSLKDVKKCFKYKINAIIHLAYINGTKSFYKRPEDIIDVALKGLINIFDLAKNMGSKKCI